VQLENIVADVLEVNPSDVSDAAGPETLPSWTSLRHLQLIVTLEEAYGISFAYQEIRDLKCVGDLRRVVLEKHGRTAAGGAGPTDGNPVVG
jgi:acyl carrier protein